MSSDKVILDSWEDIPISSDDSTSEQLEKPSEVKYVKKKHTIQQEVLDEETPFDDTPVINKPISTPSTKPKVDNKKSKKSDDKENSKPKKKIEPNKIQYSPKGQTYTLEEWKKLQAKDAKQSKQSKPKSTTDKAPVSKVVEKGSVQSTPKIVEKNNNNVPKKTYKEALMNNVKSSNKAPKDNIRSRFPTIEKLRKLDPELFRKRLKKMRAFQLAAACEDLNLKHDNTAKSMYNAIYNHVNPNNNNNQEPQQEEEQPIKTKKAKQSINPPKINSMAEIFLDMHNLLKLDHNQVIVYLDVDPELVALSPFVSQCWMLFNKETVNGQMLSSKAHCLGMTYWCNCSLTQFYAQQSNNASCCNKFRVQTNNARVATSVSLNEINRYAPNTIMSFLTLSQSEICHVSCHYNYLQPQNTYEETEGYYYRTASGKVVHTINGELEALVYPDNSWRINTNRYTVPLLNPQTIIWKPVKSYYEQSDPMYVTKFILATAEIPARFYPTDHDMLRDVNSICAIDLRRKIASEKPYKTVWMKAPILQDSFVYSLTYNLLIGDDLTKPVIVPKDAILRTAGDIAGTARNEKNSPLVFSYARNALSKSQLTPEEKSSALPYVVALAQENYIDLEVKTLEHTIKSYWTFWYHNYLLSNWYYSWVYLTIRTNLIRILKFLIIFIMMIYLYKYIPFAHAFEPPDIMKAKDFKPIHIPDTYDIPQPELEEETRPIVVVDNNNLDILIYLLVQMCGLWVIVSIIFASLYLHTWRKILTYLLITLLLTVLANTILPSGVQAMDVPTGDDRVINVEMWFTCFLPTWILMHVALTCLYLNSPPIQIQDVCMITSPPPTTQFDELRFELEMPLSIEIVRRDYSALPPIYARSSILNEFLLNSTCTPKWVATVAGFHIPPYPTFARCCVHNEYLSLRTRVTKIPTPMNNSQWYNAYQLFKQSTYYRKWVTKQFKMYSFEEWIARYQTGKRKHLTNKFNKSIENYGSHYDEMVYDAFIKIEAVLKDDFEPRMIQGMTPDYQINTGPIVYSLSKHMSRVFTNKLTFDENKISITYASGLNSKELGHWYKQCIDFNLTYPVEVDGKRFDSDVKKEALQTQFQFFSDTKAVTQEDIIALETQYKIKGRTRHGLLYSIINQTKSGSNNTTSGNSSMNIVQNYGTIYSVTKGHHYVAFIVMGDDVLIMTTNSTIGEKIAQAFEQNSNQFGFTNVVARRNYPSFCSGYFYPVRTSTGVEYFYGPMLGKLLSKVFITRNQLTGSKSQLYASSIAHALKSTYPHVPILRDLCDRLMYLNGYDKTVKISYQYLPVLYMPFVQLDLRPTDETIEFMAQLYDLSLQDVINFILEVRMLTDYDLTKSTYKHVFLRMRSYDVK